MFAFDIAEHLLNAEDKVGYFFGCVFINLLTHLLCFVGFRLDLPQLDINSERLEPFDWHLRSFVCALFKFFLIPFFVFFITKSFLRLLRC